MSLVLVHLLTSFIRKKVATTATNVAIVVSLAALEKSTCHGEMASDIALRNPIRGPNNSFERKNSAMGVRAPNRAVGNLTQKSESPKMPIKGTSV